MSLVRKLFAAHPSAPPQWLVDLVGGPPSATGLSVTPDTAEQASAVFACVRVIAETLGTLPIHLHRPLPGGATERVNDSPLAQILSRRPNPWQTPSEFKEMLTGHAVLRGMGAAQIVRRNDGQVAMLVPLHPDRLIAKNHPDDGRPVFDYTPVSGQVRTFELHELFRVIANSTDGITGRSPVTVAREAVALALATQEFSGRFFSNGARPAGILTHPQKLSKDAKERLREGFQALYGGVGNANRVAVLEEGVTYTQVGMKLDDAQFLETRKYSTTEIARLFRVPPHMIADLERSTNNNIEHQGIEFVVYTEMPWCVRWEQAIARDLLTDREEQDGVYARVNVNGLLRGDTKSRFDAYGVGRQWGWLSANDIRRLEELNPLPAEVGDVYLQPSNMAPAGSTTFTANEPGARVTEAAIAAAHRELVADTLRRAARRAGQVRDRNPVLEGHAEYLANAIQPPLQAFAELVAGMRRADNHQAREIAATFARQRAVATTELTIGLQDPEAHDWQREATHWLHDLTVAVHAALPHPVPLTA